jgi:hypothetical protein
MGTQISLKLSEKMFNLAKKESDKHGYDTLQDFIRELLRERLFDYQETKQGEKIHVLKKHLQ